MGGNQNVEEVVKRSLNNSYALYVHNVARFLLFSEGENNVR